jgi:ABC-type sulfate/molybdate transport systems ATPase subunit
MTHDHKDIYSIVERLRILEEGLNANQKSVNQLSATFKPKTVAVLTAKTDPKNPMGGKLVGGCEESEESDE